MRTAAVFINLRSGISALPTNFRRLIFCTSPLQKPELLPGLEDTASQYSFEYFLRYGAGSTDPLNRIIALIFGLTIYMPAWIYRITLKSTSWLWWPLVFLGSDLHKPDPKLLHWHITRSPWARASLMMSLLSVVAFSVVNLSWRDAVSQGNPLLVPLGYLLLIDWSIAPWQLCGLVGSLLSLLLIILMNDAMGKYRIGHEINDQTLLHSVSVQFGWIERISRVRTLIFILYLSIAGIHTLLYVNTVRCWFVLPPVM